MRKEEYHMDILTIIIIIVAFGIWIAAIISMMIETAPYATHLNFGQKIVVLFIIVLGTPFMMISQGLELLLGQFLQEGWDDDDEDKLGY